MTEYDKILYTWKMEIIKIWQIENKKREFTMLKNKNEEKSGHKSGVCKERTWEPFRGQNAVSR